MLPGGSPTLQSGGNNQKWKQSEVTRKWARWLHNPYLLGGPQHFRAGETIRSGNNQKWPKKGPGIYITPAAWGVPNAPERGKQSEVETIRNNQKWPRKGPGGYITPAAWGSPALQSGGNNQKWPTSGLGGYITLAAWEAPNTSERGEQSEVETIRSGPKRGLVAT